MEIGQIKIIIKEISKMKSNIKELLNDATNIGDEILKKDPTNILFQEKSNLFDIKDFSNNLDKLKVCLSYLKLKQHF